MPRRKRDMSDEQFVAALKRYGVPRATGSGAHESAQKDEGPEGSRVHAYLHRKEGDQDNADYWYGRAGKPVCQEPLDTEWLTIVRDLLG